MKAAAEHGREAAIPACLGGTMLGPLFLYRDPVLNAEAATKKYVDDAKQAAQNFTTNQVSNVTNNMSTYIQEGIGTETVTAMLNEFIQSWYQNAPPQTINETAYAAKGVVADLVVDRLSTSRRIPKYLANDQTDDNYIYIDGANIEWRAGIYNSSGGANHNGVEQAANPYGSLLYWETNPAERAGLSANGYPYVLDEDNNPVQIPIVTTVTDYPVMIYAYTEQTKASFGYELTGTDGNNNSIYTPTIILGAGNQAGTNQARIRKGTNGLEIMYTPNSGSDIGVKFNNDGTVEIIGYEFIKKVTSEAALPADWASQNRIFVIEEE